MVFIPSDRTSGHTAIIQRPINVNAMLYKCHDVASTLVRRLRNVMCPLGSGS